jgi:hypothetical protein
METYRVQRQLAALDLESDDTMETRAGGAQGGYMNLTSDLTGKPSSGARFGSMLSSAGYIDIVEEDGSDLSSDEGFSHRDDGSLSTFAEQVEPERTSSYQEAIGSNPENPSPTDFAVQVDTPSSTITAIAPSGVAALASKQVAGPMETKLAETKGMLSYAVTDFDELDTDTRTLVRELHIRMLFWRRVAFGLSSVLIMGGWLLALVFMGSVDERKQERWLMGCLEFVVLSALITVPLVLLIIALRRQWKMRSLKQRLSPAEWQARKEDVKVQRNQTLANMTKAMLQVEIGRALRSNFDIFIL